LIAAVPSMAEQSPESVRWRLWLWPVVAALLLCGIGLVVIWSTEQPQRQEHVVHTMKLVALTLLLTGIWSVIWVLFLSRLAWPARLAILGGGMGLIILLAFTLEFRGFSGDVVPEFGWRGGLAIDPAVPEGEVAAAGARTVSERDFPQFLGAHRDGSVTGIRLARDWSEPPRELWRQQIGAGWSSFALAGDFAVTQEQRGTEELVTCYALKSGELLWAHAATSRYDHPIGGAGPRATPAIADGRVFALGARGRLDALELQTGNLLWSVDVAGQTGVELPEHGFSASPLVDGGVVVILAGGTDNQSLVGYDAATGERRWAGGDGYAAYGSPRRVELAGVPQYVVLNGDTVSGHAVTDGEELWEYNWPSGQNAFQPLPLPGDRLFVSTGYGVGGKLLQLEATEAGLEARLLWESNGLKAKFTNAVHRDGFLYGLDDGILVSLDAATGERRWKRGRYGHGQTLLIDDLLLVLGEDGTVALVEATPEEFRELGRFAALDGRTWGGPALAGRYLVVRNDREAACYELKLAEDG
jgi:outer membrane protein assembly factor BamB